MKRHIKDLSARRGASYAEISPGCRTNITSSLHGQKDKMQAVLGKNVALTIDTPGEPLIAAAHGDMILDMLMNAIGNACKALPEKGGQITICASATPDQIYLSIYDNGHGMSMDACKRALSIARAKISPKPGEMNLAQTHGLLQKVGGTLSLYSKPGMGTTLVLKLPRHLGAPSDPSPLVALLCRHGLLGNRPHA